MEYLNKTQACEFLKRMLIVGKKWDLVENKNLSKHKIMDIWGEMNYFDTYAF